MTKARVLFLCTGNTARSQMAEAFLKSYAGDRFEVHSAGLEPSEINPFTRRVMEEIGFDLDGHHTKHLNEYMGKMHVGYLVTVCAQADKNCPTTFPNLGQRLFWPFEDPAAFEGSEEETLQKFRQIRDQVDQRIKDWLDEQGISTLL